MAAAAELVTFKTTLDSGARSCEDLSETVIGRQNGAGKAGLQVVAARHGEDYLKVGGDGRLQADQAVSAAVGGVVQINGQGSMLSYSGTRSFLCFIEEKSGS